MDRIAELKARLAAIGVELGGFSAAATTPELLASMEALITESENISRELEALEKKEEILNRLKASQGRKTTPAPLGTPAAPAPAASAKDKFGGFESSGGFLMAVRAAAGGQIHENFKNVMYEKNAEDGGYLVPEDISNEIIKKLATDGESLYAKTRQFKVSGNGLSLPIDEAQPWNMGIQAYWVDEGEQLTETKNKLGRAHWRLKKVGALVKLTDEMLEDAVAIESYIKIAAPEAIMHKINEAILTGDGAGKPFGLLNSAFTVTVPKETSQLADTIVARNVINMYTRMIPAARAGAEWLVHAAAESQLLTMKDDNDNFIYLAPGSQMNQSPYGVLLGRPVRVMMSCLPTLGDAGDIIFANLSYYYTIAKAGIKSASSIHLHFDREITAFRFTMRIDGSVPFKTPVTTQYGNYQMSAFVKLADRA